MKQQSPTALHFSGYPTIKSVFAEKQKQKKEALVIKMPEETKLTGKFDQKNLNIANDPAHWDAGWFNNYE